MIIPIFTAVSRAEFDQHATSDERADWAFELIETDGLVQVDIDKTWADLEPVVKQNTQALAGLYGTQTWEDDPLTAVVDPDSVADVAQALTTIQDAGVEDEDAADGLEELVDFYRQAASRGDAVVIVYN